MKGATHFVCILLFVIFVAAGEYKSPRLWPLPQSISMGTSDTYFITAQTFSFQVSESSSEILDGAFSRYYNLLFSSESGFELFSGLTELTTLLVTVEDMDQQFIQFNTDESYHLEINGTVSTLTAKTVFGAMHGLETFSQLVRFQMLPEVEIDDFPRFPWRGLLIDTSRHFQTMETIKRAIRGLSYDKMNVFHWHMSDGQSFPFESLVFPDLTKGAYAPEFTYSREDVLEIISYANSYGVRVVVEFDMPSHAGPSWGKGYPFLTMNCSRIFVDCNIPTNRFTDGCNDYPFDATNEQVYTFLDKFIEEVAQVFPDNFLHMGGDEVKTACWAVPHVLEWMSSHNMTSFDQLEEYFLQRVQVFAERNQKLIVNWEEVFTSGFSLAPGTVIEVWKDSTTLNEVARAGYGALLAYNWYLDDLGASWQDFYNNEPDNGELDPLQLRNLYGGETCMWAERVDDSNFDAKVWPRNSAAAERLWSAKLVTSNTKAELRLPYQRCRFYNRGIKGSPIVMGPPCSLYYV